MGKFLDDIKNDKKKGVFLILGVGALILVIVLGLLFGQGGTTAEEKAKIQSDVLVPVDTVAINKGQSYSNKQNSDFFSVTTDTEEKLIENNETKPSTSQIKQVYVPKDRSYYYSGSSSNSSQKKSPKKEIENTSSNPDENIQVAPSKRRRAPSDGLGNYTSNTDSKSMYSAVVANDNKIVKTGSYVSIRIAEDIKIGNVLLKRNSIVSGIASCGQQRMNILITSVKINNVVQPVKWSVIDEDGNRGIPIPESVLTDIATGSTSDAMDKSSSKVETSVPILGNVKVNLQKKVREVSFVINNGHRIYIKQDE